MNMSDVKPDPVLDQTNGFSALEKAANSGRKRKKRPSHEVRSRFYRDGDGKQK